MPVAMTQENSVEHGSMGDLYLRHAPEAIRLAFLLTGDRALSEDLVQEAFARLVGRLRHLRDPGAFGAYLRRTIVNLSTSHFRRRQVERAYLARGDRRGTLVRLTRKGKAVIERAMPAHLANQERLLRSLTLSERRTLARLLGTLLAGLERSTSGANGVRTVAAESA